MKIGIVKFGQTIFFDRASVNRSNTNGNACLYKFICLLAKTFPEVQFNILSKHDNFKPAYDNISFRHEQVAYLIVFPGIVKDNETYDMIKKQDRPYTIVGDDPRCLDFIADNYILTSNIITSSIDNYGYVDKIEAFDYKYKDVDSYVKFISNQAKSDDINILANTANNYKRHEILQKLLEGIPNVKVYGRLTEDVSNPIFKGELVYKDALAKLDESKYTVLVPIAPNWLTTKYIEAICHGCLPFFYKDYATSLLPGCSDLVVSSKAELLQKIAFFRENETLRIARLALLYSTLIEKYIDGQILAKKILNFM